MCGITAYCGNGFALPLSLIHIQMCIRDSPNAGAVAVFDTAFHQTLEPKCYIYPIPYKFYTDYKVRKYGAQDVYKRQGQGWV